MGELEDSLMRGVERCLEEGYLSFQVRYQVTISNRLSIWCSSVPPRPGNRLDVKLAEKDTRRVRRTWVIVADRLGEGSLARSRREQAISPSCPADLYEWARPPVRYWQCQWTCWSGFVSVPVAMDLWRRQGEGRASADRHRYLRR